MADSRLRTYEELYDSDFRKYAQYWQLCDDCFSGEEAVKAKKWRLAFLSFPAILKRILR